MTLQEAIEEVKLSKEVGVDFDWVAVRWLSDARQGTGPAIATILNAVVNGSLILNVKKRGILK